MADFTFNIDMDAKCAECKGGGVVQNSGLCMGCVNKAQKPHAKMKSPEGKAMAARWLKIRTMHDRARNS